MRPLRHRGPGRPGIGLWPLSARVLCDLALPADGRASVNVWALEHRRGLLRSLLAPPENASDVPSAGGLKGSGSAILPTLRGKAGNS